MKLHHLWFAVLLGYAVTTQAAVEKIALDRIIAIVNDDVIVASSLITEIRAIAEQLRQKNTRLPSAQVLERQVLERMILKQLQLQRAKQSGIRIEDSQLNQALRKISARNGLSLRQFRETLEAENYSFSEYRESIREEMLIQKLQQRQVEQHIQVTQREIDDWLAKQQDQGEIKYHLQHILIAVPEAASPEQIQAKRQKAEALYQELVNGADFKASAVANSDSRQAFEGGDLGWREAAELPNLFVEAVRHLKNGELSAVLRNSGGFHIVKLLEKRHQSQSIITQTQARHILLKPSEILSEAAVEKRLNQLRARVLAGEDFSALARAHSQDKASAIKGGDLGWVSPDSLVPEFEKVMNRLNEGEISPAFKSRYGWHILQVQARRKHDNTAKALRTRATQQIRTRKLDEALENWLRQLRDEAYVDYRQVIVDQ